MLLVDAFQTVRVKYKPMTIYNVIAMWIPFHSQMQSCSTGESSRLHNHAQLYTRA